MVSLVAISANPTAEGATSMLTNGAQRTVAPTIVKSIHNGTTMSLVNVTPTEPSNTSKFNFTKFTTIACLGKCTLHLHTQAPFIHSSLHPISPPNRFAIFPLSVIVWFRIQNIELDVIFVYFDHFPLFLFSDWIHLIYFVWCSRSFRFVSLNFIFGILFCSFFWWYSRW